MGKRGPQPNPDKEPNFTTAFSARRECMDTLETLRMATGKKKTRGQVICAALALAERYPDEFKQLLEQSQSEA